MVELTQKYPCAFSTFSNVKVGHKTLIEESEIKLYLRLNSISLVSQVFYSILLVNLKFSLFVSCLFTLVANLKIEMQI